MRRCVVAFLFLFLFFFQNVHVQNALMFCNTEPRKPFVILAEHGFQLWLVVIL
jgi:hypothetical protein